MKNRLEKLRNEVMPECREDVSYISSKDILNKVDEKLNAVPSERRIYMKQKFLKGIMIACAVTAAVGTTAMAMTDFDFLKYFFDGNTETLEEYVETPEKTVSDGNFSVSVDKIITSKYGAKLIVSVEAMTSEAKKIMDGEDFNLIRDTYVNYTDDADDHFISGWSGSELDDYGTENVSVWELSIEAPDTNSDGEIIRLEFSFLEGENNSIDVMLKSDVETLEYTLPGQTYGEAVIKISPMSVIIERGVPENQYIDLYDVPAYFIMDDGSVKTMNQLFNIVSSNLVREDGDFDIYEYYADARKVIDPSKITGCILDGLEYDFKDTANFKKADMSGLLTPFEVEAVYTNRCYRFGLEPFIKGIGAEKTNNGFMYDGNSYEINTNGDIIKNGDTDGKLANAVITINGEKYISGLNMDNFFNVTAYAKDGLTSGEKETFIIVP